ncbi:hypothetical protein ACXR2T_09240 [Leucobacter sp. HY1910]
MANNEKHEDGLNNGRYDIYSNGLGTNRDGDGYAHDHLFMNVNKNGEVTSSGLADRSGRRENIVRGLGRAALNE